MSAPYPTLLVSQQRKSHVFQIFNVQRTSFILAFLGESSRIKGMKGFKLLLYGRPMHLTSFCYVVEK
jgi:hypothetical protein